MKLRKKNKYLPILLIILISGISCNTRKEEFRNHKVFNVEYTDSSINVCSIEDGHESFKETFRKIGNEYYCDGENGKILVLSTKANTSFECRYKGSNYLVRIKELDHNVHVSSFFKMDYSNKKPVMVIYYDSNYKIKNILSFPAFYKCDNRLRISGISCNTRKNEYRDHCVFYIEYTDSSINVCSMEDGYESHKGSFKKIGNGYYGDNEKSLNLELSTTIDTTYEYDYGGIHYMTEIKQVSNDLYVSTFYLKDYNVEKKPLISYYYDSNYKIKSIASGAEYKYETKSK